MKEYSFNIRQSMKNVVSNKNLKKKVIYRHILYTITYIVKYVNFFI